MNHKLAGFGKLKWLNFLCWTVLTLSLFLPGFASGNCTSDAYQLCGGSAGSAAACYQAEYEACMQMLNRAPTNSPVDPTSGVLQIDSSFVPSPDNSCLIGDPRPECNGQGLPQSTSDTATGFSTQGLLGPIGTSPGSGGGADTNSKYYTDPSTTDTKTPAPAKTNVGATNSPSGTASTSSAATNNNAATTPDLIPEVNYGGLDNQCERDEQIAQKCCEHPEQCMVSAGGSEEEGMFTQLAQMALGTASMLPSSSVTAMCSRMSTAQKALAGLNAYMAYKCGSYVSQCKKSCGAAAEKVARYKNMNCRGDEYCRQVQGEYDVFQGKVSDCQIYDNKSLQLGQQAISGVFASKYADMCKKSTGDNLAKAEDLFANPDCSTAATASTPFCQELCNRPGAENNPQCAGFFANKLGGAGFQAATTDGTSDPYGNIVSDGESAQLPQFGDVVATAQRSSGGMGGGGLSGLGGGGGGGDSGDGGYGSGGGSGGEGWNTKIDRGLASGNGYTSSGGLRTGTGGGFSGYGSSGRGAITSGRTFNLRDFLPGGKSLQKTAALRAIASALPDGMSPQHTDIFKKISDQYYKVCLRNALYDCGSLRKARKAGY